MQKPNICICLYMYCILSEIQKLWRAVAVEGIDEKKVEEYLTRQGITSMQDTVQRVVRYFVCLFFFFFFAMVIFMVMVISARETLCVIFFE